MRTKLATDSRYQSLLGRISEVYIAGQLRAHQAVNPVITETYWQIGHDIVEFEQGGKARAGYGKGFSRSNVIRIRQFYLAYPKGATASHLLSWSHWVELLKLDDPLERSFYEQQTVREKWAVRELQRQKESSLFLRLAAGKDREANLQLAQQGQIVAQPADLLRDPFVFEFLKIPEPHAISETDLETRLCDHLQPFLLELGKGFTFVGRQYRIPLNNTHYRVDLVFYHRILRCFVLIDLKINEVEHHDIGRHCRSGAAAGRAAEQDSRSAGHHRRGQPEHRAQPGIHRSGDAGFIRHPSATAATTTSAAAAPCRS